MGVRESVAEGEMRLQEMTIEGDNEKAPVFDIEQEIGDHEKQIWRSIIDENGLRCVMPEAKTKVGLKDKPRPVRREY